VKIVDLPAEAQYPKIFSLFWKYNQSIDLYFISHILPLGTVAWILSYLGGKPYVIFLHGTDFDLGRRNSWKRFLTRSILRQAKRVVVNSDALGKEAQTLTGRETLTVYPAVSDEFVEVSRSIRHGVGPVDLKELGKLAVGLAPSGSPLSGGVKLVEGARGSEKVRLLTVARLIGRKGHMKVLDALNELPNVNYTIVGSGPRKDELMEEIGKRGLSDRVKLILDAKDDDLPKIYAASDIFVMPAAKSEQDREGFGIVYLEAGLFALPVIATNQPGVDEAVVDGETGLLIDDNPAALVDALKRLIADSGLRARMGSKGRTRVLEQFTREEQMKKLLQLLM
jgi:glycosyltransferase involved in cell wall biosynthesis